MPINFFQAMMILASQQAKSEELLPVPVLTVDNPGTVHEGALDLAIVALSTFNEPAIEFSSLNTNVVSIVNGKLHYVSAGVAQIRVTQADLSGVHQAAEPVLINVTTIAKPLIDADAQAYLDAESITDPTVMNATNTLVLGLKITGLWSKRKAIYLYKGQTGTKNLFRDRSQYDITPGVEYRPDGRPDVYFDVDNHGLAPQYSYGKTGFKVADAGKDNICIMSYCMRVANDDKFEMGVYKDYTPSLGISNKFVYFGPNAAPLPSVGQGVVGVTIYGTGPRDYAVFHNETEYAFDMDKVGTELNNEIHVGGLNKDDANTYGGGLSRIPFNVIMLGITKAEYLTLYGLMNEWFLATAVRPTVGILDVLGDSISAGEGASKMVNGIYPRLAKMLNLELFNYGIYGTKIQDLDTDRIRTYIPGRDDYMMINYGTNNRDDTPEQVKAYYRAKFNAAFAKNWPAARLRANVGYSPLDDPRYPPIKQAIAEVSAEYNIKAVDCSDAMLPAANPEFHPNDEQSRLAAEHWFANWNAA